MTLKKIHTQMVDRYLVFSTPLYADALGLDSPAFDYPIAVDPLKSKSPTGKIEFIHITE